MFLIIIVSANNSNHVTENKFFSEKKILLKIEFILLTFFFKSVPPLGG